MYLFIPLWVPFLFMLAATLWLAGLGPRTLRAFIRSRRHLCPHCAYPRAGLAHDAPCPECGHGIIGAPIKD